MRRLSFLLIMPILIAACASQPTPTPEPMFTQAPTETIDVSFQLTPVQPFSELATNAAENAILITPPVAGTLLIADNRQTPNYTPAPLDFTLVGFTRLSGLGGERLYVIAESNGTLTVNDEVRQISVSDLDRIRVALDTLRVYDIQGVFTAPGVAAETTRYSITVNGTRGAISIDGVDGYIPAELQVVFDLMLEIAQPIPSAPAS